MTTPREPPPPSSPAGVGAALRSFADAVAEKAARLPSGEAEEQLRAPFETLMAEAGAALGHDILCVGETTLPDRLGKPDFAVHRGGALAGYAELKAPGAGADARRFKGRNRRQFERFSGVPNMLYGDGNEWALYRGGERVGAVVRLAGDIAVDGARAASEADAAAFARLLQDFLLWEPVLPRGREGRMDLAGFAAMLAPLCRMLRDDVSEALADSASPLVLLARDWRQLLFPDATDAQFADSHAQTVTFALLLGRGDGADPFTLDSAQATLAAHHGLLSRALQILTDPRDGAALADREGLPLWGEAAPWVVGERLARRLREQERLDGQLLDNAQLAAMAGTTADAISADGRRFKAMSFALDRRGGGARIALRPWRETGRRFALARLIGDRLLGASAGRAGERLFPVTDARNCRQQAQRAFAAELLSPIAAIDDVLGGDYSNDNQCEAAERFNVWERTIRTQLVNHGRIAREDAPELVDYSVGNRALPRC